MDLGWWGVPVAVLGGAIRVSTPFLFVSLGECLTEKSGRINLGLEGILVMGAMSGYGVSYLTGSPWLGVLVAGLAGLALGLLHGQILRAVLRRRSDQAILLLRAHIETSKAEVRKISLHQLYAARKR